MTKGEHMRNPDFKKSALAAFIALTLAFLLLIVSCALPEAVICTVYERAVPMLELAVRAAEQDDFSSSAAYAEEAAAYLSNNARLLMLFFEHNEVFELLGAVESAYRIAKKEDAAQLLDDLCSAMTLLEVMLRIHEASLINLF